MMIMVVRSLHLLETGAKTFSKIENSFPTEKIDSNRMSGNNILSCPLEIKDVIVFDKIENTDLIENNKYEIKDDMIMYEETMKSDLLFSIKLEFKGKDSDRCCHLSTPFVDKFKTEEDIKVNVDSIELDSGDIITIEPNETLSPSIDHHNALTQTMSHDKKGDIVQKP